MVMDEKLKQKNKESKVSMIGPLAALLAAIITAYADLPVEVRYIMVLLLGVIAVVSVYIVFGQQFTKVFEKTRKSIKHRSLSKNYFNEFGAFIDRLEELSRDNYVDNIPYVFSNLQNMPPEFDYPRSLIYDLADHVAVFKEGSKKLSKRDFPLLIRWFQLILRVYHSQLVLIPFQQIRNLYRDKINEYQKEAYEKSRENYVRFLQDYTNFAKAINKDSGEKIAQDYFENPGKFVESIR